MAAPNIVNVSTITAKTVAAHLSTSTTTALLTNSASSGKVFKINTIIVSNVDGTNSADVTVLFTDASASDSFNICRTIAVPADSTLVLTDKNSVLYLEEGDVIKGGASAASDLDILISYEEIS
tara:strand:+ start:8474 stop:8842 length:369 start_codon:yes stop_codon:yes gene_type:complete